MPFVPYMKSVFLDWNSLDDRIAEWVDAFFKDVPKTAIHAYAYRNHEKMQWNIRIRFTPDAKRSEAEIRSMAEKCGWGDKIRILCNGDVAVLIPNEMSNRIINPFTADFIFDHSLMDPDSGVYFFSEEIGNEQKSN